MYFGYQIEFLYGVMKMFYTWIVVMVAQLCEETKKTMNYTLSKDEFYYVKYVKKKVSAKKVFRNREFISRIT